MKTAQLRNNKSYLIRGDIVTSLLPSCMFSKDSNKVREEEKIQREKEKASGLLCLEVFDMRKLREITRIKIS